MGFSTRESAAGGGRRCAQSKCAKAARSFFQNIYQRARFARRNMPWLIAQLAKPEAAQKMQRRFWDDVDLIEWKAGRIFALLSDDNRRDALERADLPVDVPHLRFQKRRAIRGDNRASRHVERSRDISHCCLLTIRDSSTSVGMTKNGLKEYLEKLNAVPLPRDVWIERRAFHPRSVSGRRPRIQHLERISAGAKRSRSHPLNCWTHCDGWRCRHCSDRLLRPDRGFDLCRCGCNQPGQERDQ